MWAPNRPCKNSMITKTNEMINQFVNIYLALLYPHTSHLIVGLNMTTCNIISPCIADASVLYYTCTLLLIHK